MSKLFPWITKYFSLVKALKRKILILSEPKWSLFPHFGISEILPGVGCKNEVINFRVCTHGEALHKFQGFFMSLVAFYRLRQSSPSIFPLSFVRVICIIFNRFRMRKSGKSEEFSLFNMKTFFFIWWKWLWVLYSFPFYAKILLFSNIREQKRYFHFP